MAKKKEEKLITFKDIFGREVKVGDIIACASRGGSFGFGVVINTAKTIHIDELRGGGRCYTYNRQFVIFPEETFLEFAPEIERIRYLDFLSTRKDLIEKNAKRLDSLRPEVVVVPGFNTDPDPF